MTLTVCPRRYEIYRTLQAQGRVEVVMRTEPHASAAPEVHFSETDDSVLSTKTDSELAVSELRNLSQSSAEPALTARRKNVIRAVLAVVGALVLVVTAALIFKLVFPSQEKSAQAAAAPPVVTVTTSRAILRPVDEVLAVTGSISSWDELKVGTEVSGLRVKSVNVEEGDRVKKGQVLAELNGGLLGAQLAQAEARLKSSQANLLKAVQPNRQEDIDGLNAALAQAENNVLQEEAHCEQAKINLKSAELMVPRYDELSRQGAVSVVEAETKRFARDNAKLELDSANQKVAASRKFAEQAKHKLLLALHGGRNEDILMMRATVEETSAQIKHLKEQIKQTYILAPDDGVILKRDVHIGDTSEMSKPFFLMSRQARLELKAQVSDLDLHKFSPGQSVSISSDEHKGNIKGIVRLISPQVDATSRLGTVRIDIPSDCGLKPGMFVKGEVKLAERKALTLPVNCMVTRGGESFVFTLEGNRAISTNVTPGMQTNEYVEIKSGLTPEQIVIDKGARFLNDRDVVEVGH